MSKKLSYIIKRWYENCSLDQEFIWEFYQGVGLARRREGGPDRSPGEGRGALVGGWGKGRRP